MKYRILKYINLYSRLILEELYDDEMNELMTEQDIVQTIHMKTEIVL